MKRKIMAWLLVLCMVLGTMQGTAWAADRPGDSAYWENLSVTDANAMAEAIATRSSTEDMVLFYTWENAGINSQFADFAAEKQIKVGCYYNEDGNFSGIWEIVGYGSISFPVVVAYNGATRNYRTSIGDSTIASFEKLLEDVGLLGGTGNTGLQPFYSSNAGSQNYSTYAASTVKSYLYENTSGGVTRVEYYGSTVIVEEYDSSYTLQSRKEIPSELPIWGGFFAGEDNNFLVFGQENPEEKDSVEVIRVVKYSKDWERLGKVSLYGENTQLAFRSGSLRCDEYNGMLYIRASHQMYRSSDGKNHQANIMIQIKESDMTVADSFMGVMNIGMGYVSHSFNQFVLIDQDQNIVAVDHGDAYPRSIVLIRYQAKAGTDKFTNGGCNNSEIQRFPGEIGANATGASVGGLTETTTGYLTAYNYNGNGTATGPRDVYLAYTAKSGLATSTPVRVTNGGNYSNPVLAPTSLRGGYLLWNDVDNSNDTLYYAPYNEDGTVGEVKTASALLSDCQPILFNGKLVWYTTNKSAPVFYTLDESGVTAISSVKEPCAVHKWDNGSVTTEPTCIAEGVRTFTCTACGYKKTEAIEKTAHTPGTTAESNNNGTHSFTCTVCHEAISSVDCTYDSGVETKPATCTEEGVKTFTCTACGYKKTEAIEKTAHTPGTTAESNNNGTHSFTCTVCHEAVSSVDCTYDSGVETKPATCTEEGVKTFTCSVCGYTKTEVIEKTAHTPGEKAVNNNNGTHSFTCTVCHEVVSSVECTYDNGVETKPATCTEEGAKTFTCTVCGYEKTETLPKTGHKFELDSTGKQICTFCGMELPNGVQDAYQTAVNLDKAVAVNRLDTESNAARYVQKMLEDRLGAAYTISVNGIHFLAPKDGTPSNHIGVDGSYTYTVTLTTNGTSVTTPELLLVLPSEDYTEVEHESYYISLPSYDNGEVIANTRYADYGDRVTLTVHPADGYDLDSLTVSDVRGRNLTLRDLGDNRFSFVMPDSRVTVDASFVRQEEDIPAASIPGTDHTAQQPEGEIFTSLGTPGISGIVLNPSPMTFTDVNTHNWFYDNVDYMWKHYLMSGVSETQFAPDATTNRAMIWTILARMNNIRTDINPGSTWYEKGMLWSMERGVTDGTNPMSDITREQLATMLWRNAGSPRGTADLNQFSDSGSVSSYALTAVRWAVANGILNGSDGRLNPKGTATRAQVAAMVARYGDKIA